MYGFAIMHAAKVYLCCLKSWDIFRKFWKKLHNAIHIHGHIRHLPLRKLLAPDIHRIEGIPAVRAVFKQVFIRLRLLFHHPLLVISKRKSLIVHIHAPLVAARHSANKQVSRSLRLPCTNCKTKNPKKEFVMRGLWEIFCIFVFFKAMWNLRNLVKLI